MVRLFLIATAILNQITGDNDNNNNNLFIYSFFCVYNVAMPLLYLN